MFTEQPAPPHPVAQVQTQRSDVAVSKKSSALVASAVAAPESIPPQASASTSSTKAKTASPEPDPVSAPSVPKSAQPTSVSSPKPVSTSASDAALTKRKQEVEQALIEITTKAHTKQKEEQARQAAIDAAKYAESGDLDQAQKAVNNPKLPDDVRAALNKRLQAKQGKKGISAIAQKAKPNTSTTSAKGTTSNASGRIAAPEYLGTSRPGYSVQPIVPSDAEIRLRLGRLLGNRKLDLAFPLTIAAPVTSLFGWRIHPISGSPRFHRGIDFGAPYGSPIVAAKTGVVETSGTIDGYGLTVIIRHGNNQQTLYAHMSQLLVQPGQVVKQGQLIGLVGSTGNSTGPHLHFEVHQLTSDGWVALDPAAVLNSAIAVAQASPSNSLKSRKPMAFNLAASGLLDMNAPSPIPSFLSLKNVQTVDSLISGLSAPAPVLAIENPATLALPFSVLPQAVPEIGWLISPFTQELTEELLPSLPGLLGQAFTYDFNPVPSFAQLPPPETANSGNAFLQQPENLRMASTQPLANRAIAVSPATPPNMPTMLPGQPGTLVRNTPTPVANLTGIQLNDPRLKKLTLSDRRIQTKVKQPFSPNNRQLLSSRK